MKDQRFIIYSPSRGYWDANAMPAVWRQDKENATRYPEKYIKGVLQCLQEFGVMDAVILKFV